MKKKVFRELRRMSEENIEEETNEIVSETVNQSVQEIKPKKDKKKKWFFRKRDNHGNSANNIQHN